MPFNGLSCQLTVNYWVFSIVAKMRALDGTYNKCNLWFSASWYIILFIVFSVYFIQLYGSKQILILEKLNSRGIKSVT